ncbi:flavin-containing monooxygenase [Agitococcus lubricus]|uniref:4-hydroxyacetophenone monooxygenase n=1 Tax=Agitococcus lubricus TaxID=1077255 RepID=A0A2T5IZW5_9GAMM|nr:NAD(P)/FAD-dependent oxidoreductase [Agitococcus lubricus]PTQ89611.1 hypothetical protein C8N29_106142 [Agitococcus lubricus]
MHTARWQASFQAQDKRIAVIGTGASAIQVIPELAKQATRLTVFQRTPAWVMPKLDAHFSKTQQAWLSEVPLLRKALRYGIYWGAETLSLALIWNTPLAKTIQALGEHHLMHSVKDPELREKLRPNYKVGCKRMLISNAYYPAMQQDNVRLVNVGIKRIVANGIIDQDEQLHELDTIVLATGFQVGVAGLAIPIAGLGGRQLNHDWQKGSEAYKGINVHGYPNLCLMMGPNTAAGHTSVIVYIEGQINYILQYAKNLFDYSYRYLNVHKQTQDNFNDMIQSRMKYTIWTTGCRSWYLTADGKNSTLWPGFSWEYRLRTAFFSAGDYDCVGAKHMKNMLQRRKVIA